MAIFNSRVSQNNAAASEIRAHTAENNARRLKKEADEALDSAGTIGMAGVTAAVAITKRSRELLFQMAVKDAKFRSTISRMRKAFPNEENKIDGILDEVEEAYKDPEWLKGKREDVDTWDLFSDPPPPPTPQKR